MPMLDTKDITWRLRQARWHGTDWGVLMSEAATEIERIRTALRVNAMRHGATNAEIDEVLYPTDFGEICKRLRERGEGPEITS